MFTTEQAVWRGVRDADHPYGFAAFTVDPGTRPGGRTSIHVTYYNVNKPHGDLSRLRAVQPAPPPLGRMRAGRSLPGGSPPGRLHG